MQRMVCESCSASCALQVLLCDFADAGLVVPSEALYKWFWCGESCCVSDAGAALFRCEFGASLVLVWCGVS